MEEKLHVDLSPVKSFRYIEISNYLFQFLMLGENHQALHTPFQCKDYLHDIFFTESTGIPTDVYGISWRKGMLNTDVDFFNMALNGGSVELEGYIPAFQSFLTVFETALGIPATIVSPTDDSKTIVLTFHKDWTVGSPILSAYTTLIRLAALYEGGDVLEYLHKIHEYKNPEKKPANLPKYMSKEIGRLDRTLNRLAALLQGKRPDDVWANHVGTDNVIRDVHDLGIFNYVNFPQVSVE